MTSRPSRAVTGHTRSKSASDRDGADFQLVISGERGTTEFCRLSRLIELEYRRATNVDNIHDSESADSVGVDTATSAAFPPAAEVIATSPADVDAREVTSNNRQNANAGSSPTTTTNKEST